MSRNVKRKFTTPVKKTANRRRRISDTSSSSLDLSDDGGYSAVEDISDCSDLDDEDVFAAEEEHLMETHAPTPTAPRPQLILEEEDADTEEDDEEDEDEDESKLLDADEEETGSWGGIISEAEDDHSDFFNDANVFGSDTPAERHVHFDVPSSDSDSTDTEDDHADMFPDIFVSQNALDPAFRREIENDPNESDESGSFWDYNHQHDEPDSDAEEVVRQLFDHNTHHATPLDLQPSTEAPTPVPAFEEPQELDGYESKSCRLAGCLILLVLTLFQLMATPLKRTVRSLLSEERPVDLPILSATFPIPTAKALSRLSVASLVLVASTSTVPTGSPSLCSIP